MSALSLRLRIGDLRPIPAPVQSLVAILRELLFESKAPHVHPTANLPAQARPCSGPGPGPADPGWGSGLPHVPVSTTDSGCGGTAFFGRNPEFRRAGKLHRAGTCRGHVAPVYLGGRRWRCAVPGWRSWSSGDGNPVSERNQSGYRGRRRRRRPRELQLRRWWRRRGPVRPLRRRQLFFRDSTARGWGWRWRPRRLQPQQRHRIAGHYFWHCKFRRQSRRKSGWNWLWWGWSRA